MPIFAVLALSPQPGDACIDLCAAPGGKTTHIAQLCPGARVVAIDRSAERANKIRKLCKTMCLTAVEVYNADATKIVDNETDELSARIKLWRSRQD